MIKDILRYCYNIVRSFIGWLMLHKNKYCNVIYFHDVVKSEGYSYMRINKDKFFSFMNYIKEQGYNTLRFDDLSDNTIKFNKRNIIIAFDDGWLSNYEEIFDFMKSKRIKYNIFLSIKDIATNPDFLSWEQVKDMHNSGIVGFGVHTYNHVDVSDLSQFDAEIEFSKANTIFEEYLGYKPEDFCYPYGFYSEESNKYLSQNKIYKHIYTSDMMYSYKQDDSVIFGRNAISNHYSKQYFVMKLKGYMNNYTMLWKRFKH